LLLVGLGLAGLPLQVAHTQGPDEVTAQAQTLEQRVKALEAKLKYLTTRIDSSGRPGRHPRGDHSAAGRPDDLLCDKHPR
jgi:hypothetical protein